VVSNKGVELLEMANLSVKLVKGIVGFLLVVAAVFLVASSGAHSLFIMSKDMQAAVHKFLSDVLLALVILELSKTIFTFLENDEAYLHSIMEASFIAVLREVILLEVKGFTLEKGAALALLMLAVGYVYYKMYKR